MCLFGIRGKFNIVTKISVPASTEEKNELIRTAFIVN